MTQNQFTEITNRLNVFYERSEEDLFTEYAPMTAEIAVTPEAVPWKDRLKLDYRPLNEGDCWGKYWECCWVHLKGTVPKAWAGKPIVMRLNLGGEALVFDEKGVPECGMTNHSVFEEYFKKEIYFFRRPAKAGEKIDLWVDGIASCTMGQTNFPMYPHVSRSTAPAGSSSPVASYFRLALFNEELYHFRLEFLQLDSYLKNYLNCDVTKLRARQIAQALNEALDIYKGLPENAKAARRALKPILSQKATDSALQVTAIGHAHIDVGWLWPVKESIRKAARTYASQIRNIERYPGYCFGGSQPQLYQFVKDNYPGLYEKVKKAVKAGRWECQGGMWVEADNNVPSGESLIRQFLHGKNFFKDEFGVDVRNLWIPDVFGYNGNTPQICQICGCSTFLTQKLSWNNINTFPYNTFRWVGIDGSEVVTHFPPENSYNSVQDSASFAAAQDRYQEAAICPEFVSLFGVGDGGGGPKEDHIEKNLVVKNMEGLPRVKMGFAQPVLDRMEAMRDKLPVWRGELYFEKHRATLTTQARTKRNNRKLEQRLLQAEFISTLLAAKKYPRKVLDKVCKTLLINQFHDIIPGSSIKLVYDNTLKEHQECLQALETLINDAAKALFKPNSKAVTLFNSLSTDYTRPVELPKAWAKGGVWTSDGKAVITQVESDGRVFAKVTVPADGFLTLICDEKSGKAVATKQDKKLVLENDLVRYEFGKDGQMKSAIDKALDVETLAAPGNVLGLYADDPVDYDAWDLDPWYRKQYLGAASAAGEAVRETGPVRSVIRFQLAIGNSTIAQEAVLASDGASVEFNTQVEWNEGRKMLRVAFPTNLDAKDATYDIQYGMIKRPTHTNTSWDSVQFEVCGQRYADLSDGQRGFAIMNDCKYGHMIRDGIVELNLLRSPKWPDYTADLGHQVFTYAIRPHQGTVIQAPIYSEAAQLNREPWRFDGMEAGNVECPVAVTGEGVSLEVVKRAEKSDEIVVRIVETRGMRTTGSLRLAKSMKSKKVVVTNAIEWTEEGEFIADKNGAYNFSMNPFQILTLKLK